MRWYRAIDVQFSRCRWPRRRRWGAKVLRSVKHLAAAAGLVIGFAPALAQDHAERLRIVGGLANVNQYTRHEQPFWTVELPRLSGGRVTGEIVPFDQAGLRGQEMLRLIQIGAVPFGTALLSRVASQDPELSAVDLAGLNPDMAALRRNLAAFRPHLKQRLRQRWGIELLAVYVYPAQVTFCNKSFSTISSLSGRRIRSASVTTSDLIRAIGAVPVQTEFAEIVPGVRSGAMECAITGAMSGNTIGLHEVTSHVNTTAITWGIAVFGANVGAWAALRSETRELLLRQLPLLERRIWNDAEHETTEGLACNAGAPDCVRGKKGKMTVVNEVAADAKLRHSILISTVLPNWVQRCGPQCAVVWNNTLKPVTGIEADSSRK